MNDQNLQADYTETLIKITRLEETLVRKEFAWIGKVKKNIFNPCPDIRARSLVQLIDTFLNLDPNETLNEEFEKGILAFKLSQHGRKDKSFCLIQHSYNVARSGMLFGNILNGMSHPQEEQIGHIRLKSFFIAGLMHDIGHLLTPTSVYLSEQEYTYEEREVYLHEHIQFAEVIAAAIGVSMLEYVQDTIHFHHENYDGSGYYHGVSGKNIPLAGRMIRILDQYDALRSNRPYKDSYSVAKSLDIMLDTNTDSRTHVGHFDPYLLEIFLEKVQPVLERVIYRGKEYA